MIAIQDVLISDDIVKKSFICNLDACKGACCWEGDYGAPLTKEEQKIIENIFPQIENELTIEGQNAIKEKGLFQYFEEPEFMGTTLLEDGACAYMRIDEKGQAQCNFERLYNEGKIDFRKPQSCHLYPIRITKNEAVGFEAWNYDQWDICSPACHLGKKEGVAIYQFLKSAIVAYKGIDFYEELDAAAKHLVDEA